MADAGTVRGNPACFCWVLARCQLAGEFGRGDWIRTSDLLNPIQVRYQAALRPDPVYLRDFFLTPAAVLGVALVFAFAVTTFRRGRASARALAAGCSSRIGASSIWEQRPFRQAGHIC